MARGEGRGNCFVDFYARMMRCICAIGFTGPILAIVGIVLIGSAFGSTYYGDYSRLQSVVELFDIQWDSGGSEKTKFSLAKFQGMDPNGQMRTFDVDSLSFNFGNDLKWTSPSKRLSTQKLLGTNTTSLQITVGNSTLKLSFEPTQRSVYTPSDLPDCTTRWTDSDRTHCSKRCGQIGGKWDITYETCTVEWVVSAFCLKVSRKDGNQWDWDDSHGGPGCGARGHWPYDVPRPVKDQFSGVIYGQQRERNNGYVRIYSGLDPIVELYYLTGGYESLGPTPESMVIVGFLMIGVGGLVSFAFVMIVVMVCRATGSILGGPRSHHTSYVHVVQQPQPYYQQPPGPAHYPGQPQPTY